MEEGSDPIKTPTYPEDEGFEHVTVPKEEESEEATTPMSSPPENTESSPSEEPVTNPEVPSPPTRVEDVPRKEQDVPPPKEDVLQVQKEDHPKGYMKFLRVFSEEILDIIYWRDVRYSVGVFVVMLAFLVTVTINPLVHSFTLALLAAFIVTLTYSAGKIAWDSFHNEPLANPFQVYLDRGFEIPEEVGDADAAIALWIVCDVILTFIFVTYAKVVAKEVNCSLNALIRLVFFADVFTSLKFLVVLYIASYFTPYVTLLTALYIGLLLLFTVPKVYELYQSVIDANIKFLGSQMGLIWSKVAGMIPFIPKKKVD